MIINESTGVGYDITLRTGGGVRSFGGVLIVVYGWIRAKSLYYPRGGESVRSCMSRSGSFYLFGWLCDSHSTRL